jgi:GTPase
VKPYVSSITLNINLTILQALGEFADYVQAQQDKRRPGRTDPIPVEEEHEELAILDQLDLADEAKTVHLKAVLLDRSDGAEDGIRRLGDNIRARLDEGSGEALMDLGLEDSGDSMEFTKADWDFALARLREIANNSNADCSILMTRNVGGDVEVGPLKEDDKSCCGKVLIRRRPASIDEVIETRIAVVGNGRR